MFHGGMKKIFNNKAGALMKKLDLKDMGVLAASGIGLHLKYGLLNSVHKSLRLNLAKRSLEKSRANIRKQHNDSESIASAAPGIVKLTKPVKKTPNIDLSSEDEVALKNKRIGKDFDRLVSKHKYVILHPSLLVSDNSHIIVKLLKDYVFKKNKVIIPDGFMRYCEGLSPQSTRKKHLMLDNVYALLKAGVVFWANPQNDMDLELDNMSLDESKSFDVAMAKHLRKVSESGSTLFITKNNTLLKKLKEFNNISVVDCEKLVGGYMLADSCDINIDSIEQELDIQSTFNQYDYIVFDSNIYLDDSKNSFIERVLDTKFNAKVLIPNQIRGEIKNLSNENHPRNQNKDGSINYKNALHIRDLAFLANKRIFKLIGDKKALKRKELRTKGGMFVSFDYLDDGQGNGFDRALVGYAANISRTVSKVLLVSHDKTMVKMFGAKAASGNPDFDCRLASDFA